VPTAIIPRTSITVGAPRVSAPFVFTLVDGRIGEDVPLRRENRWCERLRRGWNLNAGSDWARMWLMTGDSARGMLDVVDVVSERDMEIWENWLGARKWEGRKGALDCCVEDDVVRRCDRSRDTVGSRVSAVQAPSLTYDRSPGTRRSRERCRGGGRIGAFRRVILAFSGEPLASAHSWREVQDAKLLLPKPLLFETDLNFR
jgi:hypothetical protein